MTFELNYPQTPWTDINSHVQEEWYDPVLQNIYQRASVYSRFARVIPFEGDRRARRHRIPDTIAPHTNSNPTDPRTLWYDTAYIDSYEREISFETYALKLSLMEYDDLLTKWRETPGAPASLLPIIQSRLGQMIVDQVDINVRNKLLHNPLSISGTAATGGTDFAQVANTNTITTSLIQDISLGMQYRQLPFVDLPLDMGPGSLVCITSPGVVRDLRHETGPDGFIEVSKYAQPGALLRGEVGTYMGVRFISTPMAVLWNAGPVTAQHTITAAIASGDGAPDPETDKVLGVYKMGRSDASVTHYVQLDDVTDLAVNDHVTFHRSVTEGYGILAGPGVAGGVDWNDGFTFSRTIVAIDEVENRIVLDKPIMVDYPEISAGVYGYVTKGRHIHSTAFIGGIDAVVMGVAMPYRVYNPPTVDDAMEMIRFTAKGHLGYNHFQPEQAEIAFLAGSTRIYGGRQVT